MERAAGADADAAPAVVAGASADDGVRACDPLAGPTEPCPFARRAPTARTGRGQGHQPPIGRAGPITGRSPETAGGSEAPRAGGGMEERAVADVQQDEDLQVILQELRQAIREALPAQDGAVAAGLNAQARIAALAPLQDTVSSAEALLPLREYAFPPRGIPIVGRLIPWLQ